MSNVEIKVSADLKELAGLLEAQALAEIPGLTYLGVFVGETLPDVMPWDASPHTIYVRARTRERWAQVPMSRHRGIGQEAIPLVIRALKSELGLM